MPGYDLLYQLKTGERPFVSPEAAPALASSPVPLIRDTSSYLLARESIASGHLPPADEVRIEDFLAAFDNLFPAANAPLVLHLSGGPAPFGEPGMQLLQVGLRAGGSLSPDPATGAPRVVARGATLTVAFNPQVVQAYRLVGHATTTLTGPVAPVTKVDLTAGAELAGLFELWLKPAGGDDVATVELAWNDPAGGAQRHMARRVQQAAIRQVVCRQRRLVAGRGAGGRNRSAPPLACRSGTRPGPGARPGGPGSAGVAPRSNRSANWFNSLPKPKRCAPTRGPGRGGPPPTLSPRSRAALPRLHRR